MGVAFDVDSWGAWTSLGAPTLDPPTALSPTAARNLDGHLELFAIGQDNAVWHTWQTSPNGPWFPGSGTTLWESFGQPAGVSYFVTALSVGQNEDGRLEVFCIGNDLNMWHIWQLAPNANWIDHWTSLGQPPAAPLGPTQTVAVRNELDELEVFVGNVTTGEIWSTWQEEPNGIWTPNWNSLGIPPVPAQQLSFDVIRSGAGPSHWLEVIAGGAGAFWHNVRAFGPTSSWTGWSVIADPPPGTSPSAGFPSVEVLRLNQDARVELTCSVAGNDFWHTWQTAPDPDSWSGIWDNLGQPPGGTFQARDGTVSFDMQLDAIGQLEGFTGSQDSRLYRIRQLAPNNGWVTWAPISSNLLLDPDLVTVVAQPNQDGRLDVFTVGVDGAVYHMSQLT